MQTTDGGTPSLSTARLVLRAPEERDIPAWFARATDREAALFAGDPVPKTIAEGDAWLSRSRRKAATGNRVQWSVDCPDIADSVGTISLSIPKPALSFVFGRAHWGKGLATEAAQEVLRFAFDTLKLPEVSAEVVSRNKASLRVLAKLGFQKTGSFVDDMDGEHCERHSITAVRYRRPKT